MCAVTVFFFGYFSSPGLVCLILAVGVHVCGVHGRVCDGRCVQTQLQYGSYLMELSRLALHRSVDRIALGGREAADSDFQKI